MRKILMIAALIALSCPAFAGTFYGGEKSAPHGWDAPSYGMNVGPHGRDATPSGTGWESHGAGVMTRAPLAASQDGPRRQEAAAWNEAGLYGNGGGLDQSIRQTGYWEDQRAGNIALVYGSGNVIEQSIYQEAYGGSQWAFNQAEVHGGPNYVDQRIEQRSQGMRISLYQSGVLSDGTMTQSAYSSSNSAWIQSGVTI
ncbi:MAG: hypothetical protein JW986_05220 [Methanotrichaceae archaeon]|nr:hypothetical protein [Methanotrichaceae archaeon]